MNIENIKESEMNNDKAFTTRREAMLCLTEVTQDNCLRYALKLMRSMKEDVVSTEWADILIEDFSRHCEENNINTSLNFEESKDLVKPIITNNGTI